MLREEAERGTTRLRLVDRDDLLSALDRAAAGQVTIIAAPAGSGKTSLLRAWAQRQGKSHPLVLVHVDRDQQDPQLFWLALVKAVRDLLGTPTSPEPPTATPEFSGAALVDRILAELAAHDGIVLVIDDVHELTSPDALAHLTRLLTNLPPGVHAVLATRRDLPLHLHQLRLAGSCPSCGRRTCASPSRKPGSCSPPRGSRCPTSGWPSYTSVRRAGPQACAWPRSP